MFRTRGLAPANRQSPVGKHGRRGPYFLPRQHPHVAIARCLGGNIRQVASCTWLREQLATKLIATQEAAHPHCLLCFGSPLLHRHRNEMPRYVEQLGAPRHIEVRFFRIGQHRKVARHIAPAVFHGPRHNVVARIKALHFPGTASFQLFTLIGFRQIVEQRNSVAAYTPSTTALLATRRHRGKPLLHFRTKFFNVWLFRSHCFHCCSRMTANNNSCS